MQPAERNRERNGDAEESGHVERPAQQAIQRLAAGILEHQRHSPCARGQCHRARCPVTVEQSPQREFVFEPLEGLARGVFPGWRDQQDGIQAVAGTSVEADLALAKRRELVLGELRHGMRHLDRRGTWRFGAEASARRQDRWRRDPTFGGPFVHWTERRSRARSDVCNAATVNSR